MINVNDKIHRILAPRLIVLIGTVNRDGRKNIIPINNITSIPTREQLPIVWKLGQKYSGYTSTKDKIEEFRDHLELDFSSYGPVLRNSLGWIEYKIIDLPKDVGGNHLLVIGQYTKAKVNPKYYNDEINPIGNPKPIMQWERNNFAEASDIFSIDYYKDPGF